MCWSALQCVAVCWSMFECVEVCCGVLQCIAACCSVLQCVAACCSVLQYVCVTRPSRESAGQVNILEGQTDSFFVVLLIVISLLRNSSSGKGPYEVDILKSQDAPKLATENDY